MWDLVPGPGIQPRLPALGVGKLSHWTAGEVPHRSALSTISFSPFSTFPTDPLTPQMLCLHGIFQKSGNLIVGSVNKSSFIYLFLSPSSSLLGPRFCLNLSHKPSPCEIKHEPNNQPKGLPPPGSQREQPSPLPCQKSLKKIIWLRWVLVGTQGLKL